MKHGWNNPLPSFKFFNNFLVQGGWSMLTKKFIDISWISWNSEIIFGKNLFNEPVGYDKSVKKLSVSFSLSFFWFIWFFRLLRFVLIGLIWRFDCFGFVGFSIFSTLFGGIVFIRALVIGAVFRGGSKNYLFSVKEGN